MARLSKVASSLALAASMALTFSPAMSWADDAAATAAPAPDSATPPPAPAAAPDASTQQQPSLPDLVETYWHYGKIARYDLAADAGDKILAASNDPSAILAAFEGVVAKKNDLLDKWLLRWRGLTSITAAAVKADPSLKADQDSIDKMKATTGKLIDQINLGYEARRTSPKFIEDTIIAMSKSSRGYDDNYPRLAKSGELAVQVMIDMLRNPTDRQYNNTIRQAVRQLGRKALNPLLAATEMKDVGTLVDVISAIGDIGYESSIPYLARIANSADEPQPVRDAANAALLHMGAGQASGMIPADLFYDLAQKFYYGNASITPSMEKNSYVWYWNEAEGLSKVEVPSVIFNDVMSMRSSEYALKLNPNKGEAVSLWLAADTKREVDLPAGEEDASHKGSPDARYYDASAGVQYLNQALLRALHDRNAGVALKLTQSLQDIIGKSNMAGPNDPVTQALYFPNRLVRYEAAFALAESLPTTTFNGADRVVPLLAEALSQSSKPNILVIAPSTDNVANTLQESVRSLGYPVASGSDAITAINNSAALAAVDVIVISDDSDVQRLLELSSQSPRLQGASILVLSKVANNPFAVRAATDPLMNSAVMPAKADMAETLKTEIDKARVHAGAVALTDEQASKYGLRAADLLSRLAITRNTILDLSVAETPALAALSDSRAEIAKAAGGALAMFNSKTAQIGLAGKAVDEATPAEVRVSLFKSLAANAKFFGNRLDPASIAALEKVVNENKNGDVRDAAAEARGALNLPADEARKLIVGQSKV